VPLRGTKKEKKVNAQSIKMGQRNSILGYEKEAKKGNGDGRDGKDTIML